MQFKNKVKMSLNDWRQFEDDENISLAFGNVTFLSTRPNSHLHVYTESVIRQYAPSYLGQMIVAEYDSMTNDTTTHTDDKLNIVGYIPSNQEVQYSIDEDGYFNASVDIVLSKIYAIDVYNLFKSKDTKAVSVEQLVGFTPETEDGIDGVDEKIVVGFEGIGITILGDRFKPSVPNANIKMVKMSADEFESEYQKHNVKVLEDNKMSEILNKLTSIEEKLSKEEVMAKNKEEVIVEEFAEDTVVEVKSEEIEVEKETEIEDAVEPEQEEMAVEPEVKEPEEMGCGEDGKVEEKMAELESKLAEAEDKIAKYEAELSELKEFKTQIEAVKCQEIIENTLSIAKKVVDETKYTELETESKECVYANVNEWSTKVRASLSEIAVAKMEEVKLSAREDDVVDMGIPIHVEKTKESIYD